MKKLISVEKAVSLVKSGDTVMIGGFLKCGSPTKIIDKLIKSEINNLTLIANDTSFSDSDRGKLIVAKKVKKAIVSHIGTNPETAKQMNEGTLIVDLVPQGTLAEKIRSGGAGLGGFLTPTGLGTIVQDGKDIINVDGKDFILEKPLTADIAIIYGTKVDKLGNISFHGSTRNFNTIMATAGKTVIVEAEEIIDGYLDPDEIIIPSIFVDFIVQG